MTTYNNTAKRLITILLCIVMILTATPLTAFAENTSGISSTGSLGGNITYTIYKDGELVIRGEGSPTEYSPFDYNNQIKKLTVEEGVTALPRGGFSYCGSLTEVALPSTLTEIEGSAFSYTALQKVKIPGSVKSIGRAAFVYCDQMTEVIIEDGVENIGKQVFYGCSKIKSITIPASVNAIGGIVFMYCSAVTEFNVDENNQYYSSDEYGALYNKDKTLIEAFPAGREVNEYIMPDSVTEIAEAAFESSKISHIVISDKVTALPVNAFNRSALEEINIPESVTEIGSNALAGCKLLKSVFIPKNVTKINSYPFGSNANIETVTVDKANPNYSSDEYGALFNKEQTILIYYPRGNAGTEYIVPATVTEIAEAAFRDSTALESLILPDKLEKIDRYCFYGMKQLKQLALPSSLKYISSSSFYDLDSLETLTVPTGAEIDFYTFRNSGFKGLKTIYIAGTKEEWESTPIDSGNDLFENKPLIFHTPEEHDFSYYTTAEPTCAHDGSNIHICNICGQSRYDIVPAKEHSWDEGEITTAATCITPGVKTFNCTVCGEVKQEETDIDKSKHSEKTEIINIKEATCTEAGYTGDAVCSDCGTVLSKGETTNALGHKYTSEITIAPTCAKEGVMTFTCSVCGDSCTQVIPATGEHIWSIVPAVAPSCDKHGNTEGKCCSVCGFVASESEDIAPAGHKFGEWTVVKEATCSSTGEKTAVCSVCGETTTEEIAVDSAKHTDVNHDGICDDCGAQVKVNCDCYCHRHSKLSKIIWKLMRVIWKLFRIDSLRYCDCGRAHW